MKLVYNEDKIQKLLRAVSGLTGISIAFLNPDGEYLFNSLREGNFCSCIQCNDVYKNMCISCDDCLLKRTHKTGAYESHICYAGLYDAAIPMIKNGILAGSVIMGGVRASDSPVKPLIEVEPELIELYQNAPMFTDEQLENLRILLPNILFESAIEIESDPLLDEICNYINSNLGTKLSLNGLCNRFHISKNTLYQRFHEQFNCTVNEYISARRLELAKKMLAQNTDPLYIVAEKSGFVSGTYFSRAFKKMTGISPADYRRKKNIING